MKRNTFKSDAEYTSAKDNLIDALLSFAVLVGGGAFAVGLLNIILA